MKQDEYKTKYEKMAYSLGKIAKITTRYIFPVLTGFYVGLMDKNNSIDPKTKYILLGSPVTFNVTLDYLLRLPIKLYKYFSKAILNRDKGTIRSYEDAINNAIILMDNEIKKKERKEEWSKLEELTNKNYGKIAVKIMTEQSVLTGIGYEIGYIIGWCY